MGNSRVLLYSAEGTQDARVLYEVAGKLDGKRCSATDPSPPKPNNVKKTKFAALDPLKLLISKYNYADAVVLVMDRDAFEDEDPRRRIERELKGYGYNVISVDELLRWRTYRADVKVDRQLAIYFCISGDEEGRREIEDDIDRLRERLSMRGRKPDGGLKDLFKSATSKDMRESFPGIWRAIEEVEGSYCGPPDA